ncbi:MAG: hypothetical protein WC623_07250 [Pedobacter sp.]
MKPDQEFKSRSGHRVWNINSKINVNRSSLARGKKKELLNQTNY